LSPKPTSSQVRRRRIAAVTLFLLIAAAAVGVAVAAVHHHHKAAVPPPPPPPPKPFRIVFPEGFTRTQMGARVKAVAKIADGEHRGRVRLSELSYLAATKGAVVPCVGKAKQANMEGFLFPATYQFLAATTSKQLVRDQLVAFCRSWRKVDMSYARSKNLTPYDVITIASMVEREASAPAERPLVAAVIYNRLHAHMQLGIDAALRYGLHIAPTKSITKSDLASSSPYNTRNHFGLPPTPIANPGLASLNAAAHPAHVDYLYYVRKPDHKHHFFTASASAFDEYLAAHGYK
jgi:UPF0755 protein